jgi:hypothetical protein
MKATSILLVVLAVVLIAGAGIGGYYFGVSAGKTQANNVRQQFLAQRTGGQGNGQQGTPGFAAQGTPGAQGQGFLQGGGFAGRGTTGTIKAINGSTIVLSAPDKELQVVVGTDTRITTTAQVKVEDLKVGERIMVGGTTSGDKVTASSITVIPDNPQ